MSPDKSTKSRPRRKNLLWAGIRRYFWVFVLLAIVGQVSWAVVADLAPIIGFKPPKSDQFVASAAIYEDLGGPFAEYAIGTRRHLERHRLAIKHKSYSERVQIDWVAPYTQKVARDCSSIRARALLIHGLFGSAYQMSDIAASLSQACIESDVMLLPGHGTRIADLNQVSASHYHTAVMTRMAEFRRSCRNCLVVGYSMGALLATMALMEDSANIHGVVFLAPAWSITGDELLLPVLEMVRGMYKYSPFSRKRMLPTHYSYESLYAVEQLIAIIEWLYDKVESGQEPLDIPSMIIGSSDDQATDLTQMLYASLNLFSHPSRLLVYTGQVDFWDAYLSGYDGSYRVHSSIWPQIGVQGLSHFSLVYAPFNFLYGYTGIYGACMEPASFTCEDKPVDITYVARQLKPDPDTALTPAHPEFDRMMAAIHDFIKRESGIQR